MVSKKGGGFYSPGKLRSALALLSLCWGSLVTAQGSEGVSLYQMGRFEEARIALESAYRQDSDAATRRWLALSYYALLEYEQALPLLQQSLALRSDDVEVRRALAEVYLELGDAQRAQQVAEPLLQDSADAASGFLWGRIQEALGQFQQADSAYRTALQSVDPPLHQAVAVQIATLYIRQGRAAEIAQVINQAEALDPTSLDAETLRTMMSESLAAADDTPPLEVRLGYRLAYDDNAALAADQDRSLGVDANQGDFRHLIHGELLARQPLGNGFSLFGEAHLSHAWHRDLDQYDFTRQNYVASLGWDTPRFGVRLPVEFLRTDQDGDRLLSRWSASPGVYYRFSDSTYLYGFLRLDNNDYAGVDVDSEDRSGDAHAVGALLRWRGADGRAQLRAMVELGSDDADGANWQRDRWRLHLYGQYQLNPQLLVGVGGEYLHDDYDNVHDLFGESRDDRISSVFGMINYQISPQWSLQVQISHENADSNLQAYDYDRTVVSAGIDWRF